MARPEPSSPPEAKGAGAPNTYAPGLAVRRQVLGDAYVDQALAAATEFSAPLQEWVTAHCWGAVWTRPGLDLKTRSLINVAMLAALGRPHELRIHVQGALNNGATPAEIAEALLQAGVYAGAPAAVDGFRVASEVVAAGLDAPAKG